VRRGLTEHVSSVSRLTTGAGAVDIDCEVVCSDGSAIVAPRLTFV